MDCVLHAMHSTVVITLRFQTRSARARVEFPAACSLGIEVGAAKCAHSRAKCGMLPGDRRLEQGSAAVMAFACPLATVELDSR